MKRVPIPDGIELPFKPRTKFGDAVVLLDGEDPDLTGVVGMIAGSDATGPVVAVAGGLTVVPDSFRASWALLDKPVSPGDWVIPISMTYEGRGTADVGKLRRVAAYLPDVYRVLIQGEGPGNAFRPRSVSSWAVVRPGGNGQAMEATARPQYMDRDFDLIFDHHAPDEGRAAAHGVVRRILKGAAQEINALVPDGAEKKAAIDALEDAMFRANAAIARSA